MRYAISNPGSAAAIGALLCVPATLLAALIVLGVEPDVGPLGALLTAPADGPNVLGSAVALASALLLPAALVIVAAPVVRNVRTGNGMTAYPANLLVAAAILCFIALIVGAVVVDQYPCWTGVPNCD